MSGSKCAKRLTAVPDRVRRRLGEMRCLGGPNRPAEHARTQRSGVGAVATSASGRLGNRLGTGCCPIRPNQRLEMALLGPQNAIRSVRTNNPTARWLGRRSGRTVTRAPRAALAVGAEARLADVATAQLHVDPVDDALTERWLNDRQSPQPRVHLGCMVEPSRALRTLAEVHHEVAHLNRRFLAVEQRGQGGAPLVLEAVRGGHVHRVRVIPRTKSPASGNFSPRPSDVCGGGAWAPPPGRLEGMPCSRSPRRR